MKRCRSLNKISAHSAVGVEMRTGPAHTRVSSLDRAGETSVKIRCEHSCVHTPSPVPPVARVHDPTPHTHTRIAIVYRRQTGMVVGFEIRVCWCDETGRQRVQELCFLSCCQR